MIALHLMLPDVRGDGDERDGDDVRFVAEGEAVDDVGGGAGLARVGDLAVYVCVAAWERKRDKNTERRVRFVGVWVQQSHTSNYFLSLSLSLPLSPKVSTSLPTAWVCTSAM